MARGRVALVFRAWIIWGRDDSVTVSLVMKGRADARDPSEHIVLVFGVQGVEALSSDDEGEAEESKSGQFSKYGVDAEGDKSEFWHNALLQDEQTPVDGDDRVFSKSYEEVCPLDAVGGGNGSQQCALAAALSSLAMTRS
ncbi:hypothetical protein PHISCL_08927 [Aspergillus sclerotialis]|uniref:Uncharacterized protein n=1 Tax=Aspergillus sclerotialis TaxID=2070753 RepID=A0A3A2Z7Y7_9EURO|nr:hypothetical protein PHISCL_08927 [Aspergillus sclerotialis]